MIQPTFLALPLAAAGFHAIRRGTLKDATKHPLTSKLTGGTLLTIAGVIMALCCETAVIGAMLWLFCVLPLAALPAIFLKSKAT